MDIIIKHTTLNDVSSFRLYHYKSVADWSAEYLSPALMLTKNKQYKGIVQNGNEKLKTIPCHLGVGLAGGQNRPQTKIIVYQCLWGGRPQPVEG